MSRLAVPEVKEQDSFARAAMNGMIASITDGHCYDRLKFVAKEEGLTLSQWIAKESYKQADAMMKERVKWL